MIHDIVPRGEMLRLEVSLRRGVPQAQPRDYRGAPYNMTQGRALQLELRDERLKVRAARLDVYEGGGGLYARLRREGRGRGESCATRAGACHRGMGESARVGDDDHRVGCRGEPLDEGRVARVSNLSGGVARASGGRRGAGSGGREAEGRRGGGAGGRAGGRAGVEVPACMVANCACVLEHESLNCLMMFEIFSWRCTSSCAARTASQITRKVARLRAGSETAQGGALSSGGGRGAGRARAQREPPRPPGRPRTACRGGSAASRGSG